MPRKTRSRGLRIEEIPADTQTPIVPDTQLVRTTIQDEDMGEDYEPTVVLRRRPRQSTLITNTTQIEDSNPDTVQDPDESEILQELKNSNRLLWRNSRRQQHKLEKSYVLEKEKDKKWKHIDTLRCNRPVNFQSGGIITNFSSVANFSGLQKSKTLWLQMFSSLNQMPHNSRGGIGHRDAEFLNMPYVDPHSLTEIGVNLTSEHLNNLQVVDIVLDCHDGVEKKDKILYFMKDGSVKKISIQELLVQTTKELKYVHYLLKWKNGVCKEWSDMILSTIRRRFDEGRNYNGDYTPMYLNLRDQEVEM
ncbi:hypothetical protein POM88_024757 [Heracleum sosnowskyi]|uniref:Uncharacterized protein n=1 Tax=Heracleum sosnowskyi TaxID=360622 RepID=A0AAD8I526_9APIA|nr:hypothetical protein POM88_024757 [Heracleum sosnowskyi]